MTSSRCKKARECAPEPSGWIGVDEDVDRLEVATSIRLRQRKLARRWLPPCPNQRPRDESESAVVRDDNETGPQHRLRS